MEKELLVALLPTPRTPVTEVGQVFFASETDKESRRAILSFLLEENRDEQLCALIHCGHISKQYSVKDYLSQEQSDCMTLEARYFDLFIESAEACGLNESAYMPMLFRAQNAFRNSLFFAWSRAIESYLLKRAYKDFDGTFDLILQYDKKLRYGSVLIEVDRSKTIDRMTELALRGAGNSKNGIRKFLREYPSESADAIIRAYRTGDVRERNAAVRLLLLNKNDMVFSEYLNQVKKSETSSQILRLIEKSERLKAIAVEPEQKMEERFRLAMIFGTEMPILTFIHQIETEKSYEQVASKLFFSVYMDGFLHDIVVVEKGKICNLENQSVSFDDSATIRVLHPVELSNNFVFLKQLNIDQPFAQIRRPVYVPDENDKNFNVCARLSGTLLDAKTLKRNVKRFSFKFLNRDIDGFCTQIGMVRDGYLCVLEISPTDFKMADKQLVTAGVVRFYKAENAVQLNGQTYVDGVPAVPIDSISPRAFSEFLVTLYALVGRGEDGEC